MEFYPYSLRASRSLNACSKRRSFRGALIRERLGVGCIHPWPELGDLALEDQLDALRVGAETPLTRQARACVILDRCGRERHESVFDGRTVPESHATLVAPSLELLMQARDLGFRVVKVKGSPATLDELALLIEHSELPVRVDFNESLTAEIAESFLDGLSGLERLKVDFIEDPCPYDPDIWHKLTNDTGCRLALDRQSARGNEGGYEVLVVKPAVDDLTLIRGLIERDSLPFVVTSYMDHPIGQLHAAYQAALLAEAYPDQCLLCGLVTHSLFENIGYAQELGRGPHLQAPEGSGLGFDAYLEELPWKIL